MKANDLKNSGFCINGPDWLIEKESSWSKQEEPQYTDYICQFEIILKKENKDMKKTDSIFPPERYSSVEKLLQVTALEVW